MRNQQHIRPDRQRAWPRRVAALLLLLTGHAIGAQSGPPTPVAADSARADLALIRRADAARTRGAGPNLAIDTLRPTIHEFIDHACPTCREYTRTHGTALRDQSAAWRANPVIRGSPIPGLLRGAHVAEA